MRYNCQQCHICPSRQHSFWRTLVLFCYVFVSELSGSSASVHNATFAQVVSVCSGGLWFCFVVFVCVRAVAHCHHRRTCLRHSLCQVQLQVPATPHLPKSSAFVPADFGFVLLCVCIRAVGFKCKCPQCHICSSRQHLFRWSLVLCCCFCLCQSSRALSSPSKLSSS